MALYVFLLSLCLCIIRSRLNSLTAEGDSDLFYFGCSWEVTVGAVLCLFMNVITRTVKNKT